MPPSKQQQAPVAPFSADERVFCFHMELLYEARILDIEQVEGGDGWRYKIHYKGWKNTWDDWVPQDRVRKFNDENKELAFQLREQAKTLQQKNSKVLKKTGRANGSDFSSARGSEERTAVGLATSSGRGGPRRTRDFELEHVSPISCLANLRYSFFLAFDGAILHIPEFLWSRCFTLFPSMLPTPLALPLPLLAPLPKAPFPASARASATRRAAFSFLVPELSLHTLEWRVRSGRALSWSCSKISPTPLAPQV